MTKETEHQLVPDTGQKPPVIQDSDRIIGDMAVDNNSELNQKGRERQEIAEDSFNSGDYIRLPKFSRRKVLIGTALLGTAAVSVAAGGILSRLGIFRPFAGKEPTPTPSPQIPQPSESVDITKTEFNFSVEKEEDLSLVEFNLHWTPDGHITYYTTPEGKKRYFISAGVSTWMIETDGQKSLEEYRLSGELKQGQFHEVLKPTGDFSSDTDYKNGYTGITKVLQIDQANNPNHLYGITHYEQRRGIGAADTFTASVGLVESMDGGFTWEDKGVLFKGTNPIAPGDRPSGAGQPAALIKDGNINVMFIDWNSGADQLYLLKMKINDDKSLGAPELLKTPSGELKPVIQIPETIEGAGYAALPSLSFNEDLGTYLCFFETAVGEGTCLSNDLENWSEPGLAFAFADLNSVPRGEELADGQEFLQYFSGISDGTMPDDNKTKGEIKGYISSRTMSRNPDGSVKSYPAHNLKSINLSLRKSTG